MKVYLCTLFISMGLAFLYQETNRNVNAYLTTQNPYRKQREVDRSLCYVLAVLSALPFVLITALRYRVGTDYLYYAASFNRVKEGKSSYFSNPIYNVMEKIATFLGSEYIWIFCVTGVILIACYWYVIYKQSCYPVYSIFLFWGTNTYYISLNGVRQGIAMGFLFVAIYFAIHKDVKKYLVFVILACLTHRGVVFFLPAYWLFQIRIKPKNVWLIVLVSLASGVVAKSLIYSVIRLLGYGYYISGAYDNGNFEWIIAAINIVILSVFCFYERTAEESEEKNEFQIYFWLQVLATASVMFSAAVPLAKRICWTFTIGQILSLPTLTKYEKSKIGKLILNAGIILGFAISIYIGIVVKGAHKVLPYQWWFDKL